MVDLSDKIAAKLLQEYQIGWSSRFMDEPPDWDSADPDDLAQIIREVIKAENPPAASMANPDLVEKVSRALEAYVRRIYFKTDVISDLPPDWEPWAGSARAAITAVLAAIAEPTEAMQLAGHNVRNDPVTGAPTSCGTDEIYRAMIAALRKEVDKETIQCLS